MCVDCATEAGYTVIKRSNANSASFTSKTGQKARKKQLNDIDAMHRANQARKVKAAQRAKKAAQRRKIALMKDMVGVQGLENRFKKSGICRGCKGRVPVAQAVYVHRSAFVTPDEVQTVVCRGCAE
tara:strand:+ start:1190 stop:1567 length:378 start_codon:yes stop_codon:yes gene_type:complete